MLWLASDSGRFSRQRRTCVRANNNNDDTAIRRHHIWCIFLLLLLQADPVSSSSSSPRRKQTRRLVFPPQSTHRRFVLEGSATPVFVCVQEARTRADENNFDLEASRNGCWDAVETQQASILEQLEVHVENDNVVPLLHASFQRVSNLLYVDVPNLDNRNNNDDISWLSRMQRLPGVVSVQEVTAEQNQIPLATVSATQAANAISASNPVRQTYCVSGQNVTVAVLDTGIDYTHAAMGGNGTLAAYRAAYGLNANSQQNTQRDGLFPTDRVVEGRDYLGEIDLGQANPVLKPDNDPIDQPTNFVVSPPVVGHGTAVAAAILAVAPQVQLYAIKVCIQESCLVAPILDGLEYALDPNEDGDTDDAVDIINLSLGQDYISAYYSQVVSALETAVSLGSVVVVAAGNLGNIPYALGQVSGAYNALTVGATGLPGAQTVAASFTSRGPGDDYRVQQLKPELSAPGTSLILAGSGLGGNNVRVSGTSFSAPLVAGATALLVERCRDSNSGTATQLGCSPFALRSLVVNTVDRGVLYGVNASDTTTLSPLSLVGSGQVNVERALSTPLWAYSVEDVQPTISLGVLNLVEPTTTITKTLRFVNLLESNSSSLQVTLSAVFRDPSKAQAMQVDFLPSSTFTLSSSNSCSGSTEDVTVQFTILAQHVPANRMTGAGRAAHEYERLDLHEWDGWIVASIVVDGQNNNLYQISVPFQSILRRAAEVTYTSSLLPRLQDWPVSNFALDLVNTGTGIAQVDSYELLHLSDDDAEFGFGSERPPVDFRYIGYRATERADCGYLMEFAIVLWEGTRTPTNIEFQAQIFLDNDSSFEFILANHGVHQQSTLYNECRILDGTTNQWNCAGFAPDHNTNSVTTVLRACSDDLGLTSTPATLRVGLASTTHTRFATVDSTSAIPISLPTKLKTHSFDVGPGGTWNTLPLATNAEAPNGNQNPLGLLLITDSYRSPVRTGAAAQGSEALALVFGGSIPSEVTPHNLTPPFLTDLTGPDACGWSLLPISCPANRRRRLGVLGKTDEVEPQQTQHELWMPPGTTQRDRHLATDICPEEDAGLLSDLLTQSPTADRTLSPSNTPTVSMNPTLVPSGSPSEQPTVSSVPSLSPSTSLAPSHTVSPSNDPTASPTTKAPMATPPPTPPFWIIPERFGPTSASTRRPSCKGCCLFWIGAMAAVVVLV